MSAFLRYTVSRLALFVIAAALLSLTGMTGLYLVLAALVLSAVGSLVLLRNQRAALADEVAARAERRLRREDQSPE